jgi:hypothetical protein
MKTVFAILNGIANRERERMVFDWDEAARLIKESKCKTARAGLCSDWEWTGGLIYQDGKPFYEDYTYLASTWAEPEIKLGNRKKQPCFKLELLTPGWGSETKWPKSALEILEAI